MSEAAFHVHQMELAYHFADPFRWSLNCFLRALKEVPQIIQMELQNNAGFKEWFHQRFEPIKHDPVMSKLRRERNEVVHKAMLKPASKATVGIAERGMVKLGVGFPVDPFADSDDAICEYVVGTNDILGILMQDEDSLPCVQREWKLDAFPDTELTDLAASAWEEYSELMSDTVVWLARIFHRLNWFRVIWLDRVELRVWPPFPRMGWATCGGRGAG